MKKFKDFLAESKKKKWEPKIFPDSEKGAIDAYNDLVDKRMQGKQYLVSPGESKHTWVVSNPKKNFSAMVYTNTYSHVFEKNASDFEEIDHNKAMDYHKRNKLD